jgi:hypothetical protein
MDPNCKPIHARAYTVTRSVEQQLQNSKEIVRLVDIGVLEEDYSSELSSLFPTFAIPKKNGKSYNKSCHWFQKAQLIVETSPISISKIGGIIRSMEGITYASALDFNKGYYHIKLDTDAQKLCTIVFPWHIGKYKYKRLPMGIKIGWIQMVFKTSCQSLSKIWNMLRLPFYPDDWLILTNSSFKDHLLKFEMVKARLSTSGMSVNVFYLKI